ncbi:DUF6777 domain-containing protein [Nocardioides antri]|uniref:DUF6777 domain-containing protein n=1 Tax=Nocardioides antri TaxID=2607659 RepID=A0A5B1M8T2_9ACTN|nr:DUF6777 domain-containing protein [Nocardioides antri]KAA1428389.1 hypothetical protein F0U47_05550 [Nocardioides antri]
MSETPAGPGWWQASDGRWYPPDAHPSAQQPPPPPPTQPPPTQAPPSYPPGGYPPGGYPPGGYPPGGFAPGQPPPRKKSKGWLIALVLVLLAGLIGAAGAFVYFEFVQGDDEPEITGDPVTLEPVDFPGESPFVTGSAVADTSLSSAAVDAANAISSDLEVDDETGGRIATGTEPGLYGGTMDEQACDPFALADFLESEPAKAAAFAGVLELDPAEIRPYIENLTPVLLTADTWVTNHGFENGEATPFQSVMQAGTAVLIDEHGVPRVRCFCGNPLLEPETADHTLQATEGEEWDGYEPDGVRLVQGGDTALETVTLIDAESGEQFDRGLGPGQTGSVQATLRWSTEADMDLHVLDPEGREIYFASPTSTSGGELDLDKIPGCGSGDRGPHTENIFWEEDAPPGEYTVFVLDYTSCDAPTEFSLQVVVGGITVISETGTLSSSAEESTRFTFEVY